MIVVLDTHSRLNIGGVCFSQNLAEGIQRKEAKAQRGEAATKMLIPPIQRRGRRGFRKGSQRKFLLCGPPRQPLRPLR
jgi:hypothetical protein